MYNKEVENEMVCDGVRGKGNKEVEWLGECVDCKREMTNGELWRDKRGGLSTDWGQVFGRDCHPVLSNAGVEGRNERQCLMSF